MKWTHIYNNYYLIYWSTCIAPRSMAGVFILLLEERVVDKVFLWAPVIFWSCSKHTTKCSTLQTNSRWWTSIPILNCCPDSCSIPWEWTTCTWICGGGQVDHHHQIYFGLLITFSQFYQIIDQYPRFIQNNCLVDCLHSTQSIK